ncbi:MAG: exodeoxyribonuclease VII large subunit [Desulfobacteraceae bacterium]|nr:exodeoxyribonuclease VII large subunit [Desulfobacteraceae bacterium]
MDSVAQGKKIYTVSEITGQIHSTLESNFSFIWVTGEISNFSKPSSGHIYFSLKDKKALINAVMFKNQQKNLKFEPKNGTEITGFGRISVYPPRGSYQIIFEFLEPKGIGSIRMDFEEIKKKLLNEGLFDEKHKKRLPFLPAKIALITSPTGAALRDMMKVIKKRFPKIEVMLCPVSVQGEKAHLEIIDAVNDINTLNDIDIIIIARGGGSFEDLNPFNSEELARTVFNSKIPVISGVGHETDFTIIDFVSDLRAPTPTAAAEYAVPSVNDIINTLNVYKKRLLNTFSNNIAVKKHKLNNFEKRLKDPKKDIEEKRLFVDEKTMLLEKRLKRRIQDQRKSINTLKSSLKLKKLDLVYSLKKESLLSSKRDLIKNFEKIVYKKNYEFDKRFSMLFELNPFEILKRGYSITRNPHTKKIITSVISDVKEKDEIEVVLKDGTMICVVKNIN